MRKEYDFSNSVKNPYAKKVKQQITIRIDSDTVNDFKKLAEQSGMAYQTLMNSYLSDCAVRHVKPQVSWQ